MAMVLWLAGLVSFVIYLLSISPSLPPVSHIPPAPTPAPSISPLAPGSSSHPGSPLPIKTVFPDPTPDWPPYFRRLLTPALSDRIQRSVDSFVNKVPGVSLGIVHSRCHEWSCSVETEYGVWGVRSEEGDEMHKETLFGIGSGAKAFLAAAMGILMDDFSLGRNVTPLPPGLSSFSWETKIQDLFPGPNSDWQLADHWSSEKANILDILSHVSGLPNHLFSYSPLDTPQDIVRRLRYLKPKYELRGKWSYNHQMYILGAHIITLYSGMPFSAFVKDRIFSPLGMSSTTYSSQEAAHLGNVTHTFTPVPVKPYWYESRRIPFWSEDKNPSGLMDGPSGVISNTVDMLKWLGMLLNEGVDPLTNKTIIPKSVFDQMTSAHVIYKGNSPGHGVSFGGYGLGWDRLSIAGREVLQHSGALPGLVSSIAFLPNDPFLPRDPIGIVCLTNLASLETTHDVTNWIIRDVINALPTPDDSHPHPWMPYSETVRQDIEGYHLDPIVNPAVRPVLPLEAYAGTYSDAGYGSFILCAPGADTTTDECKAVIADFAKVFPDSGSNPENRNESDLWLYGYWKRKRVWASHMRVAPIGNHSFVGSLRALYPEGFGRDSKAFEDGFMRVSVGVEFNVGGEEGASGDGGEKVKVKGLGVFETWDFWNWGAWYDEGEELRDVAEVYFVRE